MVTIFVSTSLDLGILDLRLSKREPPSPSRPFSFTLEAAEKWNHKNATMLILKDHIKLWKCKSMKKRATYMTEGHQFVQ
jgi:hypothetical protein